MESRLLLDIVIRQRPAVLKLLTSEDQPLLVRGDSLLVLDLGLDVLDAIASLDLQGDGLPGEGLNEDLHTSSQPQDQMESRLFLDIVVGQRPAILELLASEDQPLLVRRDSLLVLDLGLDVLDAIASLDLQGDGLPGQSLDKDLHTSSQPEDQMEGRFFLDVIIGQSPAVLKLLAGEDQPLLVRGHSLLVLDLGLHVLDAIASLDLQGDGLPGQGLDKDLHTSSQPQVQMEGRLFLDVIVGQSPAVLELLASEDQPLLIRGDSFLILDLGLDVLNTVAGFNLQGDGFAGKGLHEDLHTSSQPQDQMKGRLLLDIIIRQRPAVLELFASEDQPLLVRGDSLL